uniref:Uncharacterized protein n=1 Tax=Cyprinus carpio TaxID=7962 RepID=A0A8C2HT49_CYPCA
MLCSGHACFFQLTMLPTIVFPLMFKPMTQLEGYLYRLSQPGGLTGPLNYFRSLLRVTQDVSVFYVLIWGEADNILVEGMSGGTQPCVRGLVVIYTIPECSHWVQQDQPEKVNKLI